MPEKITSKDAKDNEAFEPDVALSEQDERARAAWRQNRSIRSKRVAELDADPSALEAFRAEVRLMENLRFPPLKVDDANAWIWRYEFASKLLELPTVEFVRRLVTPDVWLVDGGAHVGYFTDIFLSGGATPEKVVAVEAHPENANILRDSFSSRGCHIFQVALGDRKTTVSFNDGSGHSNSSLVSGGPTSGRTYKVEMTTFDAIASDIGMTSAALIKLDVEGAELIALAGGRELLERSDHLVLIVESNPRMLKRAGTSTQELFALMREMGFVGRTLLDDFSLGDPAVITDSQTTNVAFARPKRWSEIGG
jgi:FkbM family methyltransferase